MSDLPANRNRRWVRGGAFWLCVGMAVVTAGSWIKSFWWCRAVSCTPAARTYVIGETRGLFVFVRWDKRLSLSLFDIHRVSADKQIRSWTLGGFGADDDPQVAFHRLFIPHWFVLLVILGGAWWAGPPWRNRGRAGPRGFEIVTREVGEN